MHACFTNVNIIYSICPFPQLSLNFFAALGVHARTRSEMVFEKRFSSTVPLVTHVLCTHISLSCVVREMQQCIVLINNSQVEPMLTIARLTAINYSHLFAKLNCFSTMGSENIFNAHQEFRKIGHWHHIPVSSGRIDSNKITQNIVYTAAMQALWCMERLHQNPNQNNLYWPSM